MDKFEEFETKVIGWIGRHKFGILAIGQAFLAITALALIIAMITGTVGMNLVYTMEAAGFAGNKTTVLNNPYPVTQETMNAWDTIIMPTSLFTFNWLAGFVMFLILGDLAILLYFLIREIYRMKARHDNLLALPEQK